MDDKFGKLKALLQSRKFWALVAALVAVGAGYFTGGVAAGASVQMAVAALVAYVWGVAVEDGLRG